MSARRLVQILHGIAERRWGAWPGALVICLTVGCSHRAGRPSAAPPAPIVVLSRGDEPLDLHPAQSRLREQIIERFMKPVMGRRETLQAMEWIVNDDAQIVSEAASLAEVQPALRAIARDSGVSLGAARARWQALQEADLLLESGGDPECISPAHAVGVAQWIPETGRRAGLKVDLGQSRRLTALIDPLKARIAWLTYLCAPGADPNAPGAPGVSPEAARALLPQLKAQLESLRAERRAIDERYDPRASIFAHTRYLLGLYHRFPSLDWVFQAFHGGEAGAQRLVRKYAGAGRAASTASLIRLGRRALTFEDVYFGATPTSHAAAFSYLYGRGDEHRFYWWKLLAAQRAIALYRRDARAFRRRWESLLPGRAKEAAWYPQGPMLAIADVEQIRAARKAGALLPVSGVAGVVVHSPALDPGRASDYAALRPEAKGALKLVAAVYRRDGGTGKLGLGDLTLTSEYVARESALRPPESTTLPPTGPPPGSGPAPDFNYHTTGLAFDILRPADSARRKRLEYALGWLADHGALWWMTAESGGSPHYHVVPNPAYSAALVGIAVTGSVPR